MWGFLFLGLGIVFMGARHVKRSRRVANPSTARASAAVGWLWVLLGAGVMLGTFSTTAGGLLFVAAGMGGGLVLVVSIVLAIRRPG